MFSKSYVLDATKLYIETRRVKCLCRSIAITTLECADSWAAFDAARPSHATPAHHPMATNARSADARSTSTDDQPSARRTGLSTNADVLVEHANSGNHRVAERTGARRTASDDALCDDVSTSIKKHKLLFISFLYMDHKQECKSHLFFVLFIRSLLFAHLAFDPFQVGLASVFDL